MILVGIVEPAHENTCLKWPKTHSQNKLQVYTSILAVLGRSRLPMRQNSSLWHHTGRGSSRDVAVQRFSVGLQPDPQKVLRRLLEPRWHPPQPSSKRRWARSPNGFVYDASKPLRSLPSLKACGTQTVTGRRSHSCVLNDPASKPGPNQKHNERPCSY